MAYESPKSSMISLIIQAQETARDEREAASHIEAATGNPVTALVPRGELMKTRHRRRSARPASSAPLSAFYLGRACL